MKKISFVIVVLLGAIALFGVSRTFAADCSEVNGAYYDCDEGDLCTNPIGGCECFEVHIESGAYCSIIPPVTCSFLGNTLVVGQSFISFSLANAYWINGQSCSDYDEVRTCQPSGILNGSYSYIGCTDNYPEEGFCVDNGTYYDCDEGKWCNNPGGICMCFEEEINNRTQCIDPSVCTLPRGGTINSGSSVTAYQASSVSCGSSCTSQTRMCMNGVLGGTYTSQSCSVNTCGGGGGGGGSSTPTCTAANLVCTGGVRTKRSGVSCQGGNLGNTCTVSTGSSSTTGATTGLIGNITGSPYGIELNTAYLYAYSKGITTKSHINNADMMGTLIRKHLAKMIVNFGKNVIGITANTGINCNFTDMAKEDTEMQYYAIKACQMGLMGLKANGTPDTKFNPNDMVTRAQFGTVLSRIVRGTTYNTTTNPYYARHLLALKIVGIMKDITKPNDVESRGWVMLMMMRTDQYLQSIND